MRKILAVALLDGRRLGFGVLSAALIFGLVPALASGLGIRIPAATLLTVTFGLVGAAAGVYFGADFAEGRSSFFFARPLGTAALILGRVVALIALTALSFAAFMASNWLSTSDRSRWAFAIVDAAHLQTLAGTWALWLFISLAIAVRSRTQGVASRWRDMVVIPLRLGLCVLAFLLVFGLFSDLVVRAYSDSWFPMRAFFASWVVAGALASFVAMAGGRTERLRIASLQMRVIAIHFALVAVSVVGAWAYVLHPGPDAILAAAYPTWGSPDGRTAYVTTRVGRGDGTFAPIFAVDIASGEATRLNADRAQGPWTSDDGGTVVWSEATPVFFRPLLRRLGGVTSFRVKTGSGAVAPLPMPRDLPDFLTAKDLSKFAGAVNRVWPSSDGDVFAIRWDRHLTFTSRTRGQLSDINLAADMGFFWDAIFLPSGHLRTAVMRLDPDGTRRLSIEDVDPASGVFTVVERLDKWGAFRFDRQGARGLVTSGNGAGRGAALSLVHLDGRATPVTPLLLDAYQAGGIFLGDGRVVVVGGGSMGGWDRREFAVFSSAGQKELGIDIGPGLPPRLGIEMFPGIVSIALAPYWEGLALVDVSTGKTIREFQNFQPQTRVRETPPPGSAAARLLESRDGRLYELPSPLAEPRLLLPRPRS